MLKKNMHGKPLVYLDTAATAQKPQAVIDTICNFYQNHYATVHRAVYELSLFANDQYQKGRKQAQKFLNAAKPEEIIFTRGTTESINLVASSFGKAFVNRDDEILITEMEHHSNIVPWQILCEEVEAHLKVVPFDTRGVLDLEAFEKLLSKKTKLVACTHISNALGTENPIKTLIEMAHQKGAYVLVDGAQSAPHKKIDVQNLNADFFVCSGHKLYGPTGIGVLYGKEALLNAMPPYQGGGDMIERVTFEKTTYGGLPLKFEAGTPLIAEVVGLGSALEYLEKIGMDVIEKWERHLLQVATLKMEKIPGLKILGTSPHKAAIISFTLEGIHPLDIGTLLNLKGIAVRTGHLCAQPIMDHFGVQAMTRASFGLYSTESDIDVLVEALYAIKEIF